jgi:hypothetical protein
MENIFLTDMTRTQRSVGSVKYLHLQERHKSPNFMIEELEEILNWSWTSLIAWKQIVIFFYKDATALFLIFVRTIFEYHTE